MLSSLNLKRKSEILNCHFPKNNKRNWSLKMLKRISIFLIAITLFFTAIVEESLARAGGRSSRSSSSRSSTSYFNQGSRGSKTFEGGSANGKNYAPMQRTNQQQNSNNQANQNGVPNQAAQPNNNPNFFQRNPFLTTFGAALAGSWLGHMLFGSSAMGMGGGSGGFMLNLLMMAAGAFLVVTLVKFFTRSKNCQTANQSFGNQFSGANFSQQASTKPVVSNIAISNEDKNKFQYLLVDIQNAWSNQDMTALKTLCTAEMAKYFSDSLAQNASQGLANKVEDVDVTMLEISESWSEGEMQYATAVIEWSSFDFMVNVGKNPQDADYIAEGGNRSLVMTTEAWTFVRYGSNANWILSAIAQVE